MSARIPHNPTLILPAGTKIVLRSAFAPRDAAAAQPAGGVGCIIKSPVDQRHSYRVRFVDGCEARGLGRSAPLSAGRARGENTLLAQMAGHRFEIAPSVEPRSMARTSRTRTEQGTHTSRGREMLVRRSRRAEAGLPSSEDGAGIANEYDRK
jgi:hypothetical protein